MICDARPRPGLPRPDREPVRAWVALGANLGPAAERVRWAIEQLDGLPGTQRVAASRLYRSAPHEASGPDFINAVACIDTRLSAPELLQALQALEAQADRQRPYRNAPRTLDLDLLFYGQARVNSPQLCVPHPRWQERAFVLLPLAQLDPGRVTPAMLHAVRDQAIEPLEDTAP